MQTTPDLEKLPDSIDPDLDLEKVRKQCRALVKKRAKYSAGVAVVPVPFLDVAVDAGLLTQLLPEISKRFGLISERESAIDLESKEVHWAEMKDRAVEFAGLMATRGLVKKTIQGFGGRIVAKQVTKFVPLGGQIVAASLGYMIFKKIAFDHINQCYKLAKDIQQKQHSRTVNSGAHAASNKDNSTEKKSVADAAAEDKSVVDKVVDKASVVIDKASEKVSDVMDKASAKAEEVSNKAADTAQEVAEKADAAADKVADKAEQVAEKTAATAKKAAEEADNVADKVAAKAEEAADKAADDTQKVSEKAEEIADEAAESIKKASATKANKK